MIDDQREPGRLLPTLFVLLAVAGLILTALLAGRTFPAALIELSVERSSAQQQALDFLRRQGARTDDAWQTTAFAAQATVQDYLLAADGFAGLEALARQDLNLAHWKVRLFRPLDPHEWSVTLSTRTGRLLGFQEIIPEEAPAASLPYSDAMALALEALVARPRSGLQPADLRLLSSRVLQQPNRTDYSFVWERPALRRGEATYRYAATIYGDRVGALSEYYHLPDSWSRIERWHLRRGALLNSIGWMLTFGLMAAMGLVWLWAAQRRLLRLRFAVSLLVPVLLVAAGIALNDLVIGLKDYPTNVSPAAYLASRLEQHLGLLINLTTAVVVAGMAGEALLWAGHGGRQAGSISLSLVFTRAGITSRPVVQMLLIGICTGLAQLGYLSLFYWIGGELFGVWQPISPTYDDLLSTPLPWLYAMALGLLPAVGEELVFRLGAITLLRRLTAMPWLSVVVSAVIWAALHATYAQRPFFIRLIELTVVGIAFGYLFLRYGILASMAAHYTYNASLLLPLLIQGSWATMLGGLLAFLGAGLLLLPAIWAALRRRRLSPAVALAAPLPAGQQQPAAARAPYLALQRRPGALRRLLLAGLAGMALLISLIALLPAPALDNRPLTRGAALALAEQEAVRLQLSVDGLYGASDPSTSVLNLDLEYLEQHPGIQAAEEVVRNSGRRAAWLVRFNAWDRDDALMLQLGPQGQLLAFDRRLPEDVAGAALSQPHAHRLALDMLASLEEGSAAWELIESSTITRPRRVDHRFTWQAPTVVGEAARPRALVVVQGEQVSSYWPYLYVPPEYRREREQRTAVDLLREDMLPALPDLGALLLTAACLILALRRPIPLRPVAIAGGIGLATTLIERLLQIEGAQLAQGPQLVRAINDALFAAILSGTELGLVAGGSLLLWRRALPQLAPLDRQLAAALGWWRHRDAPLWRDARLLALLLLPALLALDLLQAQLAPLGTLWSPAGLDSLFPAAQVLLQGARQALRATLLLSGATALLLGWGLGRLALPLVTFGAVLAAPAPEIHPALVLLAWPAATLAGRLLRGNLVALWLLLWTALCLPDAILLLTMQHTWYQLHGIIIVALLIQPYIPAMRGVLRRRAPAGAGNPSLAVEE